jgi:hypothetical protein
MMSRAPLFALLALALPAAGCPTSNTVPECTPIDLSWIESAPRCGEDPILYNDVTAPRAVTPGCQVFVNRLDFTHGFDAAAPNLRGIRATLSDVAFFGNGSLNDLSGLETLERIGGVLQLRMARNLTSLHGLRSLRSLGNLAVDTTAVGSLEGLEQLREVGHLVIRDNPNLTSLRGLEGLCRVTNGVTIFGNPQLPESEIQAFLDRVEITGPIVLTRP